MSILPAPPRRRATDSYGPLPSPVIETFTGVRFKPLSPELEDINVQDIAHALSQQCRFAGHTKDHYSVAEHSVRVSWLLREWEESFRVQLWGLLHDASEAYLTDVPTPLKRMPAFQAYREAEHALMGVICERFHLPKTQPDIVHKADAVLLSTEVRDLMANRPEHWGSLEEPPMANVIEPWPSREAERRFLARFAQLYARL